MKNLDLKYDEIINKCSTLFRSKLADYGATWLLYRDVSLVDQLWIKARRIITLEENGDNALVSDSRSDEFIGIINYSVVMLMRMKFAEKFPSADEIMADTDRLTALDTDEVMKLYMSVSDEVKALMLRKNHDYGSAWEGMHPSSVTDQIVIKICRIKSIMKNGGRLIVSEGIDAQLSDIINYCVFSLIKIERAEG